MPSFTLLTYFSFPLGVRGTAFLNPAEGERRCDRDDACKCRGVLGVLTGDLGPLGDLWGVLKANSIGFLGVTGRRVDFSGADFLADDVVESGAGLEQGLSEVSGSGESSRISLELDLSEASGSEESSIIRFLNGFWRLKGGLGE